MSHALVRIKRFQNSFTLSEPWAFNPFHSFSLDQDECSLYSPCEQVCINTNGSFECSCMEGFEIQDDMSTCLGKDCYCSPFILSWH